MRAEQDQLRKRRDVSTQLLEHHITCVDCVGAVSVPYTCLCGLCRCSGGAVSVQYVYVDCVGVLVGRYLSSMSWWIMSVCWWGCICPVCCGLCWCAGGAVSVQYVYVDCVGVLVGLYLSSVSV